MHRILRNPIMVFTLLAATPALAHVPAGTGGAGFAMSLVSGFVHPLGGLDHIMAMVAVGLFAAMAGGRAIVTVPAAFAGAMVMGFGLAIAGTSLPFVEPMIIASVIVFGLLIAAAFASPATGMGLALLFGLFHGYAHGAELAGASAAAFGTGFVVGTALLHGVGIALALSVSRLATSHSVLRTTGAATAALGVALGFGL